MISLALRSGVAPEYIIDQLSGTRSPKMGIDEGDRIHSIPDGIATVLEHSVQDDTEAVEIEDAESVKTNGAAKSNGSDAETIVDEGESPECPECDAMLTYQEGCKSCEFCGWSEC
jgi:ribonucleoside-diphosphate reductase alpha chain